MRKAKIEIIIYTVVILLCLLAISLVALSPVHFTGAKAVYLGF